MPLEIWHFSQWTGLTLKFLVAHPCSVYEPIFGISDLLSAVLRSQGSSKQPHPAFWGET